MAKAGTIEVDIRANSSQFVRSMRNVERSTDRISRQLRGFGRFAAIAGGAIVAAFGARQVREILLFADQVDKLNTSLGTSEELLSGLRFAAEQGGSSFEVVAKGIGRSQKAVADAADGLRETQRAFDDIGLSIDFLRRLSPDQQFLAIADALQKVNDQNVRQQAAGAIFGRGSAQAILQLGNVSDKLREAARLGAILSEEGTNNAADWNDAWNKAATAVRGIFDDFLESPLFRQATIGVEMLTDEIAKLGGVSEKAKEKVDNLIVIDQGNEYIWDKVSDIEAAESALAQLSRTSQEENARRAEQEAAIIAMTGDKEIEQLRDRKEAHDRFNDAVVENFRIAQESGFSGMVQSFKFALQEMLVSLVASKVFKFLAGTGFGASAFGALGLAGFQTGGQFQVGGSGGRDSQVVAFRASPGETVSVSTPGQAAGGGVVLNNSYSFNGVTSADRAEIAAFVETANRRTEANIKDMINRRRFV